MDNNMVNWGETLSHTDSQFLYTGTSEFTPKKNRLKILTRGGAIGGMQGGKSPT